jgi:hypothetical protein
MPDDARVASIRRSGEQPRSGREVEGEVHLRAVEDDARRSQASTRSRWIDFQRQTGGWIEARDMEAVTADASARR